MAATNPMAIIGQLSTQACLPPGPPFPSQKGVSAEVAFGGLSFAVDDNPDWSIRLLWAHSEAGFASDAFSAVDPANVTVFSIYICRIYGAVLGADRGLALPTGRHFDVVGEFCERVLHYLDARARKILNSIMNQRAAEHTCCTAGAFFAVIQDTLWTPERKFPTPPVAGKLLLRVLQRSARRRPQTFLRPLKSYVWIIAFGYPLFFRWFFISRHSMTPFFFSLRIHRLSPAAALGSGLNRYEVGL
jgi:hypothetical protein